MNAYTTKLVQFAIAVGTTQAAKLWLIEHAPTMRAAEKIEADRTVVMALAKKCVLASPPSQTTAELTLLVQQAT